MENKDLTQKSESKKTIKVVETFVGYGAQCLALTLLKKVMPSLDFVVVGIADIKLSAIKAYNKLHGTRFRRQDITKMHWRKLPPFDLLTYSFPCQDLSVGGKQRGAEEGSGTRSSLLWEIKKGLQVLAEVDNLPRVLLMENVTGLLNINNKQTLDKWANFLETLGYTSFTEVVNAKDFGIPQARERVFMVSLLKQDDTEINFSFPEPIECRIKPEDILERFVDDSYYYLRAA